MTVLPHAPTGAAKPPRADVLLVTVTDTETNAVFATFQELSGHSYLQHHHIDQKIYYELGIIGGARVWLVCSEMGVVNHGGALVTVANAIDALHPQAILMVGIAFGIDPSKQHIGDVLVSQQLMLYDLQRVGTGASGEMVIHSRGDRVGASPVLVDRARHSRRTWPPPALANQGKLDVQIGLVLSGDKLVDHEHFRSQLHQLAPEAIGGEMEGAGLYLAASKQHIDWLLIKAISDWADGNKRHDKDKHQALAARNAALFTFHMIQQGGFASDATSSQEDIRASAEKEQLAGESDCSIPKATDPEKRKAPSQITNTASNISNSTIYQGENITQSGIKSEDIITIFNILNNTQNKRD